MNIPETFFSVHEQLVLFALSCGFGVALGVCYDLIRTFRLLVPHNQVLVLIEDILFLSGYAVFLSVFASAAARGELRFYYVIGNLIGFALYLVTVGSAVNRTLRKLLAILAQLLKWVSKPFCVLYAFLCKKAGGKFVEFSKVLVLYFKNVQRLLLKLPLLLYNKVENTKRKNVKCVAKKKKNEKKKKGTFQPGSR